MPFGLINIGAKFQRAMDIGFKGVIHKSIVIYLDDIIVYSKDRNDHLIELKHIFKLCKCWAWNSPIVGFGAQSQVLVKGFVRLRKLRV